MQTSTGPLGQGVTTAACASRSPRLSSRARSPSGCRKEISG
ncbi:hypothetical protein ACFYZE_28205 [Streptomyces sp. NPDC001796]